MSELPTVEPKIVNVAELLAMPLTIPDYQRPYKWEVKHVDQLINDLITFKDKKAYRLGTVVLHRDGGLNIVDGQQRILTLVLILLACKGRELKQELDNKLNSLLNSVGLKTILDFPHTSDYSKFNLRSNYDRIVSRIHLLNDEVMSFLLQKCEFVTVTLNDVSEAFQFFDSQNARGLALQPTDLLKAYHLRLIGNKEASYKAASSWEQLGPDDRKDLFDNYLFRIKKWSKGHSGRYFTKDDIGLFKGITVSESLDPYSKMIIIAYLAVDKYNDHHDRIMDKQRLEYPHQIDQPVVNGKYFFDMVCHYKNLLGRVRLKDSINQDEEFQTRSLWNLKDEWLGKLCETLKTYEGRSRQGDLYVLNLFECFLLYFVDKFDIDQIPKFSKIAAKRAYDLRLRQYSVKLSSMDNHAISKNDDHLSFQKIRDVVTADQLLGFVSTLPLKPEASKVDLIFRLFSQNPS